MYIDTEGKGTNMQGWFRLSEEDKEDKGSALDGLLPKSVSYNDKVINSKKS